jgi:hypothetical protein
MTDFPERYDRLVTSLLTEAEAGKFTPAAVPHHARQLRDEIKDLVLGFRDTTGERVKLPEPLIPMRVAAGLMRRLRKLINPKGYAK